VIVGRFCTEGVSHGVKRLFLQPSQQTSTTTLPTSPAQDPTCAKVSITGRMRPVPEDDWPLAERILFSRHPKMRSWPADHGFVACALLAMPNQSQLLKARAQQLHLWRRYELHPEEVRLLDYYGGAQIVPVSEYYAVPSVV